MALTVNIKGGTTKSNKETLCRSCSRCTVIDSARGVKMYCHVVESLITEHVNECNSHTLKTSLSLRSMEQIAYVLDSENLRKGKPGFCSPKAYKEQHKDEKHGLDYNPADPMVDDDLR